MFSLPCIHACAADEDNWAILIGINTYKFEDINPSLNYALNDVADMKDVLVRRCNFRESNIVTLTDAQATKSSIVNMVNYVKSRANPKSIVVFYFSGHGNTGMPDYDRDESDGYDEYICPYDSRDGYDWSTEISDDELAYLLGGINARNIVAIFDSCNSGGMVKGSPGVVKSQVAGIGDGFADDFRRISTRGARDASTRDSFVMRKFLLLMATKDTESSTEYSLLQNGGFTYFLVEGFNSPSADTNRNNWISAEEAFHYAKGALHTWQVANRKDLFEPQIHDADPSNDVDLAPLGPIASPITMQSVQGWFTSPGQQAYYYFDIPPGTGTCTVTLSGPLSGANFDLYVKRGDYPTTASYDYAGRSPGASETIPVHNPPPGRYYVLVHAYSGSGSYTISEVHSAATPTPTPTPTTRPTTLPTTPQQTPRPVPATPITMQAVQGRFTSPGQQAYYYFDIPPGTRTCTVTLSGPSSGADFDLYVKKGDYPTTSSYDYASSKRGTSCETITVQNPATGRYYVMVRSYSGSGTYTISETHTTGTLPPTTPLPTTPPTPSVTVPDITQKTVQGYLSYPGDKAYYSFGIPQGVTWCTVTLQGTAGFRGDFDLYVRRGDLPTLTSYHYASAVKGTSHEKVTVQNPQPGRYFVMVYSSSGHGSFSLAETHTPGTAPTTIMPLPPAIPAPRITVSLTPLPFPQPRPPPATL